MINYSSSCVLQSGSVHVVIGKVFTLNMKKIVPMIDCSLSITRFVT